MILRVGDAEMPQIHAYLRTYYRENVYLLSDLRLRNGNNLPGDERLALVGYREDGALLAAQAFYRFGRWFPFFHEERALEPMLVDALSHHINWVMGVRRVVDPLLDGMVAQGHRLDYDEDDQICLLRGDHLQTFSSNGVRPAHTGDVDDLAALRLAFEHEYFGVPLRQIDRNWCRRIAQHYLEEGTYVAIRDGRVVSMAAVEAAIPEMVQIGAVYTLQGHRGQGLAKAVVSALAEDRLGAVDEISLVVRIDNEPAMRAYTALGFRPYEDYRMARLVR